jgi:hypothetical protein
MISFVNQNITSKGRATEKSAAPALGVNSIETGYPKKWTAAGIRSCAHWLNWKCSITTVENEPYLLMITEYGTAQHIETLRSIVV